MKHIINATQSVYLDDRKESWVSVEFLPASLIEQLHSNYATLFSLHPEEKDVVYHKLRPGQVASDNGSAEGRISRWYRSYGQTPQYDVEMHGSYMFGDFDRVQRNVPAEFQPVIDYFNAKNSAYNQFVINWYQDGKDYIAYHSDYDYTLLPGSDIVVVNINERALSHTRSFFLSAKCPEKLAELGVANDITIPHVEIPLTQGVVIKMGGLTQKKFRHGVPRCADFLTSRISITLRNYV